VVSLGHGLGCLEVLGDGLGEAFWCEFWILVF
jgi:hypothetical protein